MTRSLEFFKGKHILIVEQSYACEMLVQRALERYSAVVVGPTSSISHALAIVGEMKIDGVILDLALDAADAFSLSERLADRDIPMVFAASDGAGYPSTGEFRGFTLSAKVRHLAEIGAALFEPSAQYSRSVNHVAFNRMTGYVHPAN